MLAVIFEDEVKAMKAIRQGDVMLKQVEGIPEGAKRVPLQPLALGEKTGHHHSLESGGTAVVEDIVEMWEAADGTIYVRIPEGAEDVVLTHQEHKTHAIEPGIYERVIQRENTDWGARAVVD